MKSLFTKEINGSLSAKADLEEHLKKSCTDERHQEGVTLPPPMPPVNTPEHEIDISPPRLSKNDPDVLQFLWKLMKVVWQKKEIPTCWRRAGGILIPKEKDSSEINQFRHISISKH